MATDGSNTVKNQEAALAALLTCANIEIAAKKAKVGARTLYRWLAEDAAFREQYRAARREIVSHAIGQMQRNCAVAVRVLAEITEDADAPASSRVSAARAILDTSVKAVELDDLAARIEALEALQVKP
jgi:tRNA U55 pseudouridine synthase TruB